MRPGGREYYPEIDGLRALAIIAILLFHLDFAAVPGGFVGVDVFLVISGYLISGLIIRDIRANSFSLSHFYYRRIRRLFPALLFTVLVSAILGALLLSPRHFREFSGSALSALFSMSNIYFWLDSDYFSTSAKVKPLLHFWSLSVEEQFYLFWPAVISGLLLLRKGLLFGTIFALGALSVLTTEWMIDQDPAAAYFLTPFRVAEFFIGALCVWAGRVPVTNRHANLLALGGLAAILAAVLAFDETTRFPGYAALLPCVGAALLIVAKNSRVANLALGSTPIVHVGRISYSLYLIHWPIIVYWQYFTYRSPTLIEKLLLAVTCFVAADFMYRWVECPFRLGRSAPRVGGKRFFAAMVAVSLAVVVPSTHAFMRTGWHWRVNGFYSEQPQFGRCRQNSESSTGAACVIGSDEPGSADMLVIGDSHAGRLRPALDYIGKKLNLKVEVWAVGGCKPLWDTYLVRDDVAETARTRECSETIPRWEQAVLSGRYKYVVLAARWVEVLEEAPFGTFDASGAYLVARGDPPETALRSLDHSRQLFAESLSLTIRKIREKGVEVVLFSQVPELGRDVQDCANVPRVLIPLKWYEQRCDPGVSYSEIRNRIGFTDNMISSTGSEEALVILPSRYFCDDDAQKCVTVMNGVALYDDNHHVTREGSLWLARQIEDQFAKLVARATKGAS